MRLQILGRGRTSAAAGLIFLLVALSAGSGQPRVAAHAADGHPAKIQEGRCGQLGAATFTLTGVGATVSPRGTPIPSPETFGPAPPADASMTILDRSLSDVLKGERAIVIYASDAAMDQVIACGNVAGILTRQMNGMTMPGDQLLVSLGDANGAGLRGFAVIELFEGGKTAVMIVLPEATAGGGTPGATPPA